MQATDHPYFAHPPVALAHRGGEVTPGAAENSLSAFRAAAALGYTHVETDVHVTSDGVLVAFHDSVLDRVTDGSGELARLPWSAVRQLRIRPHTPASVEPHQDPHQDPQPIPRLSEVLEALPTTCFNIDLKAAGAVEPLWRTIVEHDAYDRVCVGSFSDRRLRDFRALSGGRVATSAGPAEVLAWRLAPAALARRVAGTPAVLQVPVDYPVAGRRLQLVTPRLIARLHAVGKQVHVWTVNDARQMRELLDLGVDGIVTDRPQVLRDVLTERGEWHGGALA